jgi:hypothetical protein
MLDYYGWIVHSPIALRSLLKTLPSENLGFLPTYPARERDKKPKD